MYGGVGFHWELQSLWECMHFVVISMFIYNSLRTFFIVVSVSIIRLVFCLTCLKKLSYNAVTIKKIDNGKLRINEHKFGTYNRTVVIR